MCIRPREKGRFTPKIGSRMTNEFRMESVSFDRQAYVYTSEGGRTLYAENQKSFYMCGASFARDSRSKAEIFSMIYLLSSESRSLTLPSEKLLTSFLL